MMDESNKSVLYSTFVLSATLLIRAFAAKRIVHGG